MFRDLQMRGFLAADVEPDQLRHLRDGRGDAAGAAALKLRFLLLEDPQANGLATDPVEGLGGDAGGLCVDEG